MQRVLWVYSHVSLLTPQYLCYCTHHHHSGNTVVFTDDSFGEFDTVVLCTGFRMHLPFLSKKLGDTYGPQRLAAQQQPQGSQLNVALHVHPASGCWIVPTTLSSCTRTCLCRGWAPAWPSSALCSQHPVASLGIPFLRVAPAVMCFAC